MLNLKAVDTKTKMKKETEKSGELIIYNNTCLKKMVYKQAKFTKEKKEEEGREGERERDLQIQEKGCRTGEKCLLTIHSDKALTSRTYKELQNLNNKKPKPNKNQSFN